MVKLYLPYAQKWVFNVCGCTQAIDRTTAIVFVYKSLRYQYPAHLLCNVE